MRISKNKNSAIICNILFLSQVLIVCIKYLYYHYFADDTVIKVGVCNINNRIDATNNRSFS